MVAHRPSECMHLISTDLLIRRTLQRSEPKELSVVRKQEICKNTNESGRQSSVRDVQPSGNDSYARESLTWRRMRPWQIWTLSIVVVVVAGALFFF